MEPLSPRSRRASNPRCSIASGSAADPSWIDQLDCARPVVLTAQGLFPYFTRSEIHAMLGTWARRLPGCWLLFDAVNEILQASRRKSPSTGDYQPPEWTWVLDDEELSQLRELSGLTDLTEVRQDGTDRLLRGIRAVPVVRNLLPAFPVFRAQLTTSP